MPDTWPEIALTDSVDRTGATKSAADSPVPEDALPVAWSLPTRNSTTSCKSWVQVERSVQVQPLGASKLAAQTATATAGRPSPGSVDLLERLPHGPRAAEAAAIAMAVVPEDLLRGLRAAVDAATTAMAEVTDIRLERRHGSKAPLHHHLQRHREEATEVDTAAMATAVTERRAMNRAAMVEQQQHQEWHLGSRQDTATQAALHLHLHPVMQHLR